jgi:biotin transport system substrate-specific component
MGSSTVEAGLRDEILDRLDEAKWIEKTIYVLGFALVTAALAQVRVYAPWNPFVPYTGQVLGVVGAGLALGPWMGYASMLAYLVIGATGAPVFADFAGGVEVLAGATAGYLYAFPIAAGITGALSRRYLDRPGQGTLARLGSVALAGYVALFGIGVALLGLTDVLATDGLGGTMLVSSALVCLVGGLLWRWSREESQAFLARMAIALVGVLVIYAIGWIGLVAIAGLGWEAALANGVLQFVPVDLGKAFLAAGATSALLPPEA